jgi:hypothetical protein
MVRDPGVELAAERRLQHAAEHAPVPAELICAGEICERIGGNPRGSRPDRQVVVLKVL